MGSGYPCVLTKNFRCWTANIDALFPLFLQYLKYSRLDCWYHHTMFNLITDIVIYSCHDIPFPLPSHMLQHWMKYDWVGPEYLSFTRKNKSCSWRILLYILHLKCKDTFSVTELTCDGWCNQSFCQKSWLNMISWSKDLGYNVSYYHNMNIVTQSSYIIKLGVPIMAFTQCHEPHSQLDVIVTWSGKWSSVDQWASNRGLLGTLVV
jgi:hypothetical protein